MGKRPDPQRKRREPQKKAPVARGIRSSPKGDLIAALADVPPPAAAGSGEDAAPSVAPIIFIEIDSSVSGGYINNRFDITVRGRAMSAVPIEEIRLQIGDWVTSLASYGQPERAMACVLPDGRPGRQRTFQFNLPRPGNSAPDRCLFAIVARTDDDIEHAETFEIAIDPAAADTVAVVSGPTGSALTFGAARPHAVIYIERGTIDAHGVLSVHGWAVSLGPILALRIFAGDKRIAKARIGGDRDDVAMVFPGYPNAGAAGFSLSIQLDVVSREAGTVRAQLVCANGFGQEVAIPIERLRQRAASRPSSAGTPDAADGQPDLGSGVQPQGLGSPRMGSSPPARHPKAAAAVEMSCEVADLSTDGVLTVQGWAVCPDGIAQIRVLFDERDVGLAAFGHERQDVAKIYPDIPMSYLSGFKFQCRLGEHFEGDHDIRVVVRGALGSEGHKYVIVATAGTASPHSSVPEAERRTDAGLKTTSEQAAEFKFGLDSPTLSNGVMVEPVTGRLTVEGWLISRSGVASFEVFLDDQRLGDAHYGLARQDVDSAFPDWPNALRSGFAFHCQPRSLLDGQHTIRLAIRAANGVAMDHSFQITVCRSDDVDDSIGIRKRVPRVEVDMILALLAELDVQPMFHLILRQDGPIAARRVRTTLDSLRLQPYDHWRMTLLAADEDVAAALRVVIQEQGPRLADQFTVISPSVDKDWGTLLARADSSQVVLHMPLLAGDVLSADALLELALAAGRYPGRNLLYGDEVRISPVSQQKEPFFKPDFSPDLLLSANYLGRPWAVTSGLLAATGATPGTLLECGEYDLVLRCAEQASGVHHVPKLLCQRSAVALDEPAQEQAALVAALMRRGIDGAVLTTAIAGTWRVKRALASQGKVSIIIPTCAAHGYIKTCLDTLRAKTSYPDYEIICIDNIPNSEPQMKTWLRESADKVVDISGAFNWSVFNNRAAAVAEGDYFLFLNDDIEITHDDWLDALVENAQRPEVAIVGPQLLYRDGKVQHAGMFLSDNGVGRHAFRFAANDDPCYFGLALTQRNVMAVTGACMLIRRDTFERLGRFDEAHEIINNDLDFCLRAHRAGMLTVYTPYASLIHYELASRASMEDVFDLAHFSATWKTTFAAGDPYFNPRLSKQAEDYRPDDEPVQWVVSGSPLFHVEEIARILVIKLDHIGDFVTALPAIRRLRTIFPKACITVLAGPVSREFVALEPSIDEFIPFSFFHARSQLGERELLADDYDELAAQLHPYRFDLAVDLRKHPSTRDVLKYAGARFLAGFDYLGQFPFLDIALNWDGDRNLQRKRSHIVDDLLGLVNAIGHATENDRQLIQPTPQPMPLTELPKPVQALFDRPVVAIHPGAGNVTRQWPEAHFSALIDLLIEKNGVNVLLVGGPDDAVIADTLLDSVLHRESVASMAGRTSLAALPRLLKNCVLYIGNNSGPKHIAAGVGIPTIGIHSGVVDPVEWGPIGPRAVALRRNMACSPCYLANADECPRALACLKFFDPSMVYETANMMLKLAAPVPAAKSARKAKAKRRQPITEPV